MSLSNFCFQQREQEQKQAKIAIAYLFVGSALLHLVIGIVLIYLGKFNSSVLDRAIEITFLEPVIKTNPQAQITKSEKVKQPKVIKAKSTLEKPVNLSKDPLNNLNTVVKKGQVNKIKNKFNSSSANNTDELSGINPQQLRQYQSLKPQSSVNNNPLNSSQSNQQWQNQLNTHNLGISTINSESDFAEATPQAISKPNQVIISNNTTSLKNTSNFNSGQWQNNLNNNYQTSSSDNSYESDDLAPETLAPNTVIKSNNTNTNNSNIIATNLNAQTWQNSLQNNNRIVPSNQDNLSSSNVAPGTVTINQISKTNNNQVNNQTISSTNLNSQTWQNRLQNNNRIIPSNQDNFSSSNVAPGAVTTNQISNSGSDDDNGALQCISECKPSYPSHLSRKKLEGTVIVRCQINQDGVAININIGKSSGNNELDQAAIEAVQKMRFSQVSDISKQRQITINFNLEE